MQNVYKIVVQLHMLAQPVSPADLEADVGVYQASSDPGKPSKALDQNWE